MEVIKMYEYQSRESGYIQDYVASLMTDGDVYNLKCGQAIIDIKNKEAGEKLLNQLFINVKEVPSLLNDLGSEFNSFFSFETLYV
ncbi:hypothetical protein R9C00_21755 [Flammeovirgaceae bacterium SG7u.111]|nr:hypothetical protein [Flammeovirgaceae bacterium SG7u.132]WPO34328.1 hypothetical protein R9C00_21755 [Flammeovirgaceae bacterium SG7u.111]